MLSLAQWRGEKIQDGMKDYVEVVKDVLYYDDGEMGYIVKERKLSEGRIC